MSKKIKCQCSCNCTKEFEPIEKELLLNLITHGRVDAKRSEYLTSRVGSKLCKNCFTGIHLPKKTCDCYDCAHIGHENCGCCQ
jgi:hypothetical protein